jgi:hypothetical protein
MYSLLAELMLPDGAHLRTEDWTVFFLNQTIPDPDKISTDDYNSDTPLLYALNLVRTKHDKEARRYGIIINYFFKKNYYFKLNLKIWNLFFL